MPSHEKELGRKVGISLIREMHFLWNTTPFKYIHSKQETLLDYLNLLI